MADGQKMFSPSYLGTHSQDHSLKRAVDYLLANGKMMNFGSCIRNTYAKLQEIPKLASIRHTYSYGCNSGRRKNMYVKK